MLFKTVITLVLKMEVGVFVGKDMKAINFGVESTNNLPVLLAFTML